MRTRILICLCFLLLAIGGCRATRVPTPPPEQHLKVLTYNVNWGGPGADVAVRLIADSGAHIVCLQETHPEWEKHLRKSLTGVYPHMQFRHSMTRAGGGLAFLSKVKSTEVAYIPSRTGWFDSWVMAFRTSVGEVQVLNVHLRPPISDSGSWVSGYFTTRDDREEEMRQAWAQLKPHTPALIVGDFNDGEKSRVIRWLEGKGMHNALPQFDRSTPTWRWRTRLATLRRRMDHIIYSPDLTCYSARVLVGGASDHFPAEAVFARHRD